MPTTTPLPQVPLSYFLTVAGGVEREWILLPISTSLGISIEQLYHPVTFSIEQVQKP